MNRSILILSFIILFVVHACIKTEPVSPVPEITFNSYELSVAYDTLLEQNILIGKLEFSFIDGDADIGMYYLEDTVAWNENNYNLFLTPYEKVEGEYFLIEPDSSKPPPYYTIAHDDKLDRVGQNKTIKGKIKLDILYFIVPEYDTIRYDFYIVDRAKHASNIESTSDIEFRGITLN
ncbi:hypothetical protein ES703_69762 [subsurface metagenome]